MELYAYIFTIVYGIFLLVTENKSFFYISYIPIVIMYMIIVRFSGYDTDILSYEKYMTRDLIGLYFQKEFIFWGGLQGLYKLFNNEFTVFICADIIWIYILIKTSQVKKYTKNHFPEALFIIIVTSFPIFFGYENIYRQLFAMIVVLYAYSLINENIRKSYLVLFLALFIHNSVVFILPIFIAKKFFRFNWNIRLIISIFTSLILISLIIYAYSTFKSGVNTNQNLTMLYYFMFITIFTFYFFKYRFNLIYVLKQFPSFLISIILLSGLIILPFDYITERVGMMLLITVIYDLFIYSNTLDSIKRIAFRILLQLLFTLPVLLSSSSMSFFDR